MVTQLEADGGWGKARHSSATDQARVAGEFRRLPVVPSWPGAASSKRHRAKPHPFPHPGMQLHCQMALLHFSAVSAMFFRFRALSPPLIPMSFRKVAIDAAGNPRQPTSIVQILTAQPFDLPSLSNSAYFVLFNSPESSALSSLGTVSSTSPTLFVLSDMSSMSGRRLVSATLDGNFSLP